MVRMLTLLALLGAPSTTGETPLEFRCDGMEVLREPNRTLCRGNVVARQGNMLLCCDHFEAVADDQWQWTSLRCTDGVRAARGDERMWSERAELNLIKSTITLTRNPWLQRGTSLLRGDQITVTLAGDHANITNPRGVVIDPKSQRAVALNPPSLQGALPITCPLPAGPPPKSSP